MKSSLTFILLFIATLAHSQTLQFHYDLRHTLNPTRNVKNFTTLYFEYFKNSDTLNAPKSLGPLLVKTQVDFTGTQANIAQFYTQIFQQFRLWKPKIYVNLQYSGGLGVTDPRQYSYYIANSYSIGASYPFAIGSTYVSAEVDYKLSEYVRPERYLSYTFYFWKGLFHYKAEFSGDFSAWVQDKNHGDAATANLTGKTFLFFAEPQVWYKVTNKFAIGSKNNFYYHILTSDNVLLVYPTLAIRVKL